MNKDYKKLYEDALERAKYLKENTDSVGALDVSANFEYIFPELKESEDEKIRKALLEHFGTYHSGSAITNDVVVEDVLTWLEKQGEKKPIEQDTEVNDLWVYIREWNDKFGRLPKDEDELASCIDYVMKRQKPSSWSEEDEKILNEFIESLRYHNGSGYNKQVDWLKSIKDRIQPQSKQEWSEEDESHIGRILSYLESFKAYNAPHIEPIKKEIDWLKSLKHNHWKPSETQMNMLLAVLNDSNNITAESVHIALKSLYNDLKKL